MLWTYRRTKDWKGKKGFLEKSRMVKGALEDEDLTQRKTESMVKAERMVPVRAWSWENAPFPSDLYIFANRL